MEPLVGRDVLQHAPNLGGQEEGEAEGGPQREERLEEEREGGAEAECAKELAGVVERGGEGGGQGDVEPGAGSGREEESDGEEVEGQEEEEAPVVGPAHAAGQPDAVVVEAVDVDAALRAVLCGGGFGVKE